MISPAINRMLQIVRFSMQVADEITQTRFKNN